MSLKNKFFLFIGLLASIGTAVPASFHQAPSPALSTRLFAADLFGRIAKEKFSENVVFSPLSIQTALAMAYLGADGNTATELKKGLHIQPNDNVDQVVSNLAQILNEKTGDAELNIANRIFVHSDYQLRPEFNEKSQKYFNSEVEELNFKEHAPEAIEIINKWVEGETKHKIKNLLQPGSVDGDTSAIIANAIYFKGNWKYPFGTGQTFQVPFYISEYNQVMVDTMYGHHLFKYGEFPDLDATGLEIEYCNSNFSMLLLLPSQNDGLASMEAKLSSDLIELSSKMEMQKVHLLMPKFKIECTIELPNILKMMGIRSLFENASLPGIFQSGQVVRVSDAQHKALIEVYENGSEEAGLTYRAVQPSRVSDPKVFNVNHPFLFAIKSHDVIYFVGHVVKF